MEEMIVEEPTSSQEKEIPTTRLHVCSDGKHRNDEQYEIYKKYEESLVLKKAQFNKDPDQFVHLDDVIMGVINGDKGQGCYFGRFPLLEAKAAMCTLQYRFFNALTEMDYAMDMKNKSKIITAPGAKPESGIIV